MFFPLLVVVFPHSWLRLRGKGAIGDFTFPAFSLSRFPVVSTYCRKPTTNKSLQDYLDRLYVSTEQRIQERVAAAAAASMRFR